jgi:hypothetical protein
MRIHADKRAIRALGVAESFRKGARFSTLAGVVMRSDLVIDGVVYGRATLEGDDSTRQILRMCSRLHRNDINLVMLQGCIISLYNIVDVDEVSRKTGLPLVALTFKESAGIEGAIRHHFPEGADRKLELYAKLGERSELVLKTGHRIFVRTSGLDSRSAERILNLFTLQGSLPEPVRVAKLLARARERKP